MPLYKAEEKKPKVPSTQKVDMLISGARPLMALKLILSKECGLRPIELMSLRVKDIDLEQRLVYPSTAKHGSGRVLKISQKAVDMLKVYILKKGLALNDKLFKGTSEGYSKRFRIFRNKLSEKLQDPSFRQIRLYDLRHYFATQTYHRTRDILFTKQQMGHKKIETTLLYTQLIGFKDEEWTCRTARTIQEASLLIESGFEYVTEVNGIKLLRKRK